MKRSLDTPSQKKGSNSLRTIALGHIMKDPRVMADASGALGWQARIQPKGLHGPMGPRAHEPGSLRPLKEPRTGTEKPHAPPHASATVQV